MSFSIEEMGGGYLLFTIKRNEKRNAINNDVMEGLKKAIDQAKESYIKALVITGSGEQAFCSGGDLNVFHLLKTKEEAYSMLSKMSKILYSLLTLPKPTIALINGAAIGGGCEIATACDFRIAKKGIKVGFVQGQQSITTGWGGGAILAEKFPSAKAMKWLMDANIQQSEALFSEGFIDQIYDSSPAEALEYFLKDILTRNTEVLESYKNIWIRKWNKANLSLGMEEEVKNCAILWESDEHHSYVSKFINKN